MVDDSKIQRQKEIVAAVESFKESIKAADSVSDVPQLTELFNNARTSSRNSRNGRYVALFDVNDGKVVCRSVAWLESGTHYRDTGADFSITAKPWPLQTSSDFLTEKQHDVSRILRRRKQKLTQLKDRQKMHEVRAEQHGGEQ